jgi:hypothetical protein
LIGLASHHHAAAITPRDIRRSASGVRSEISSVLRAGIVDQPECYLDPITRKSQRLPAYT